MCQLLGLDSKRTASSGTSSCTMHVFGSARSMDEREYCCPSLESCCFARLRNGGQHRRRRLWSHGVFIYATSLLCLSTLILLLMTSEWLSVASGLLPVRAPSPRSKARRAEDVYLCAIVRGKVGNALFSYMSALGLARANNMTLVLKDESVLPQILRQPPRTAPDFDRRCSDALYMPQRHCCVFDERLARLPHDDHYLVKSCLISWRFFTNLSHKEQRALLTFRDDVMDRARAIVRDVRLRASQSQNIDDDVRVVNVTLVGMHIRRGDQAGLLAYWNGHNPVTPEYVERAMRYFTDHFSPVHFLVASQDTSWCRNYVAHNRKDVTIMEGNSAAVDIAALTLTDHMIVSIGTYGWWAGYLNPGIKTYMKDFIGPRSSFSNSFGEDLSAPDYVYPGWVGL